MTRGGMKEYVDAIRGCYIGAGRKEKSQILDEAVRVTGQHRKAAIGGGKVDHVGGMLAELWCRRSAKSNCLDRQDCQEVATFGSQRSPLLAMLFKTVRSFRMHAVSASFFGLPAASSRW